MGSFQTRIDRSVPPEAIHWPVRLSLMPAAPVLEAIVCETQHAALMTAVVASAFCGLCTGQTRPLETLRRDLLSWLPQDPAILIAARRRGFLETELTDETLFAATTFFAELKTARGEVQALLNETEQLGFARACVVHQRSLARTWKLMCLRAAMAVEKLDVEACCWLPESSSTNAATLVQLLERASEGEAPCLDAQGQPSLPDMPQRRRSSRKSIGQNCILLHDGAQYPVFARDVSAGGLGLERTPPMRAGDNVTIKLDNGRCFGASVAWQRGPAAGLKFSADLSPNDPLLFG